MWCEKDAEIGSIEGTTDELGISVRVARGFMSATRVNDIANELSALGKPTTILFLGDHDPSGRCIEESARKAVLARCAEINDQDLPFEMVRLAIHKTDIKNFRLPPLRVKDSDPRADKYRRKFGGECVELDALPPSELRRRIIAAVRARRDEKAWNKSVHIERVELDSIVSFAEKLQNVNGIPARKALFDFS